MYKRIGCILIIALLCLSAIMIPGPMGATSETGGLEFSFSSGSTLMFDAVDAQATEVETTNTLIITNNHESRVYQDIVLTFYDIVGVEDNLILTDNIEVDCYLNDAFVATYAADGNNILLYGVSLVSEAYLDIVPRIKSVGSIREGNYLSTFSIMAYYEVDGSLSPAYSPDIFSTNIGSMEIQILGIGNHQLLYNDGNVKWDYGSQRAGAFVATTKNRLGVRNNGNQIISKLNFTFDDMLGVNNASQNISTEGITLTQVLGRPLGGFRDDGVGISGTDFLQAVWSPDGQYIAVLSGNNYISLINYDNGNFYENYIDCSASFTAQEYGDLKWLPRSETYTTLMVSYTTTSSVSETKAWSLLMVTDPPVSSPSSPHQYSPNATIAHDFGAQGVLGAVGITWAAMPTAECDCIRFKSLSPSTTWELYYNGPGEDYNIVDMEFLGNSPNWIGLGYSEGSHSWRIFWGNYTEVHDYVQTDNTFDYPASSVISNPSFSSKLVTVNGTDFYALVYNHSLVGYTLLHGKLNDTINLTTINLADGFTPASYSNLRYTIHTDGLKWISIVFVDDTSTLNDYYLGWYDIETGTYTSYGVVIDSTYPLLDAHMAPSSPELILMNEREIYGFVPGTANKSTLASNLVLTDVSFSNAEPRKAYITTNMGTVLRYDLDTGAIDEMSDSNLFDASGVLTHPRLNFAPDGSSAMIVENADALLTANSLMLYPGGVISDSTITLMTSMQLRWTHGGAKYDLAGTTAYAIGRDGSGWTGILGFDGVTGASLPGYPIMPFPSPDWEVTDFDILNTPTKTYLVMARLTATYLPEIYVWDVATSAQVGLVSLNPGGSPTADFRVDLENTPTVTGKYNAYAVYDDGLTNVVLDKVQINPLTGAIFGTPTTLYTTTGEGHPTDVEVRNTYGIWTSINPTANTGYASVFSTLAGAEVLSINPSSFLPQACAIQPISNRGIIVGQDGMLTEVNLDTITSDIRTVLPGNNVWAIGRKYIDGGLNDADMTLDGKILIEYITPGLGTNLIDFELEGTLLPGTTKWFKATLLKLPPELDNQVFRGNYSVTAYVPANDEWLAPVNSSQELTIGRSALLSRLYYTDGAAPLNFPPSFPDALNVISNDAFIIDNTDSTVPITKIRGVFSNLRTTDLGSNPATDVIHLAQNSRILWYTLWDFVNDMPMLPSFLATDIGALGNFNEDYFQTTPISAGDSIYGRLEILDLDFGHPVQLIGPYSYSGAFTMTTLSNPLYYPSPSYVSYGEDVVVQADTFYQSAETNTTATFSYQITNNIGELANITNELVFGSPLFPNADVDVTFFDNLSDDASAWANFTVPVPIGTPGGQYVFTISAGSADNSSILTEAAFTLFVPYENNFFGYINQIGNATDISYQFLDNSDGWDFAGSIFPLDSGNDLAVINIHNQPIQKVEFQFTNLTNASDVLDNIMAVKTVDGMSFYGTEDGLVEVYTGGSIVGVGKILVLTGIIEDITVAINDSLFYTAPFDIIITDLSSNQYVLPSSAYTYSWADMFYPIAMAGANLTVTVDEEFTLDGSDSYDPDGTIAGYVWDVDDDLVFELIGMEQTHSFSEVGAHYIHLKVTDDDGLTDVDSIRVMVTEAPTVPTMVFDPASISMVASSSHQIEFTFQMELTNTPATISVQASTDGSLYGNDYDILIFDSGGSSVVEELNITDSGRFLFNATFDAEYTIIILTEIDVNGDYIGIWNFTAESGDESSYAIFTANINADFTPGMDLLTILIILAIIVAIIVGLVLGKRFLESRNLTGPQTLRQIPSQDDDEGRWYE